MLQKVRSRYPGVYYVIRKSSLTNREERVFYIQYRSPDGKQHHEKIGTSTKGMTEARANKLRIDKSTGKLPSNTERRILEDNAKHADKHRWTIERLWNEYSDLNSDLSRLRTDKGIYDNHLKSKFGKKTSDEIPAIEVDRLRKELSKKLAPATVWAVLELLRRLINFGVKKNLSKPANFVFEMPKVSNEKTEMLSQAETQRLLKAIAEDSNRMCANAMLFALLTGLRKSEIFKLRWKDIDFEKGFFKIMKPKSKKKFEIHPLNTAVRDLLDSHPRPFPNSPFVFPGKNGGQRVECKHVTNRIKTRAKLPKDFRSMHGLRHSFASALANQGLDLYSIQKLLRHGDYRMTQRYAHLHDDTLKRASEIAGQLFSVDSEDPEQIPN